MVDTFNPDEWEVVWSGRDSMLPPRPSKPNPIWQEFPTSVYPDKRRYNKKDSSYWGSLKGNRPFKGTPKNVIIEPAECDVTDDFTLNGQLGPFSIRKVE